MSLKSDAGVDTGDMDVNEVAELFGKTSGFKTSDPNVVSDANDDSQDDDDF